MRIESGKIVIDSHGKEILLLSVISWFFLFGYALFILSNVQEWDYFDYTIFILFFLVSAWLRFYLENGIVYQHRQSSRT